MERNEKRRGTWQVAFGLCDPRLFHEDIRVVRRDVRAPDQTFAGLLENDEERYRKAHAR